MLGSPIAHSKSPALHAAAHRVLGLEDRSYELLEVGAGGLAAFLAHRGEGWRGLSIPMPLKAEALAAADSATELARLTGAANTLVFEGPEEDAPARADNTDVHGIASALRGSGIASLGVVEVLGAGATAGSALAAAATLGAVRARILARSEERAEPAVRLARALGLDATFAPLEAWSQGPPPDLVLSTLPVDASARLVPDARRIGHSALFDVVYSPWPSPLALAWMAGGKAVVSGESMLLHQAVEQARQFAGVPEPWAEDERAAVEIAMRDALRGS